MGFCKNGNHQSFSSIRPSIWCHCMCVCCYCCWHCKCDSISVIQLYSCNVTYSSVSNFVWIFDSTLVASIEIYLFVPHSYNIIIITYVSCVHGQFHAWNAFQIAFCLLLRSKNQWRSFTQLYPNKNHGIVISL